MKHVVFSVVVAAVCICCAAAQGSSSLGASAERLAACTMALDVSCVVSLSVPEIYEQLGSQDSDFPSAQARFFDTLRRSGRRYIRFDIEAPWAEFSKAGIEYAFVPYRAQLQGFPEVHGYMIGISIDGGAAWKFVDGCHITSDNIHIVIPGYAGERRPPADRC